jgi:copper chaperone
MLKLKVEGMTCNHCVMTVKKALSRVPGVERPRSP